MAERKPFEPELVSYALSRAERFGASYAEATLGRTSVQEYVIKQGALEGYYTGEFYGLRVRLAKNGYMHSVSILNPTENGIAAALSKIDRIRRRGALRLSGCTAHKASYSVKAKEIPEPRAVLDAMFSVDREIKAVKNIKYRLGDISCWLEHRHFESTDGSSIDSMLPGISAFFSITVSEGGSTRQRMLQYGAKGGLEKLYDFEIGAHAREDARNMRNVMLNGVDLHGRERNIVISPEIAGIAVHESIGHPFEADRVLGREAAQAGTSYITSANLGIRVGSSSVSISDDPTIRGSNGFYLYDDEGVKARKKILVREGMQTELLHNRSTSAEFGVESNSAARSSGTHVEPLVRMSNTYLEPDRSTSFDELLEEARSGIYIKNFTEWNIDDTRSFSKYQGNEAYMIKGGRLGKPVRNFVLESKTTDFWSAVRMVSKELEFTVGTCGKGEPQQGIPVSMGGPSALLVFG